jgi:hypothetical protein
MAIGLAHMPNTFTPPFSSIVGASCSLGKLQFKLMICGHKVMDQSFRELSQQCRDIF